jgi:hypothetical protein
MKCRYWKECNEYNKLSRVCNISGGMYSLEVNEPAICYTKMEESDE